jgi:hypothetical protein
LLKRLLKPIFVVLIFKMKRSFSFTEPPIQQILGMLPTVIQGIEKIISVYSQPGTEHLESRILQKENDEYIQDWFHITGSDVILKRFRSESSPYTWLRPEDFPFEIKSKDKVQLTIFNEFNNIILLIRIRNHSDSLNDLFFFYFNPDLSNFGALGAEKMMSTDNKTIIANLLRNFINTQLERSKFDLGVFLTLQENNERILQEIESIKKENKDLKERIQEHVQSLSSSYLEEISGSNSVTYYLTDSGIKKLTLYPGHPEELKPILARAAKYAEVNASGKTEEGIPITEYHIYPEQVEVRSRKTEKAGTEFSGQVNVRYEKAFSLLNRLEQAATLVKSQNKMLTSTNIGKECKRTMSPPAISEAVKKHKGKILDLFRQFPERWRLIRTEFRPILNILNAIPDKDKLSA